MQEAAPIQFEAAFALAADEETGKQDTDLKTRALQIIAC